MSGVGGGRIEHRGTKLQAPENSTTDGTTATAISQLMEVYGDRLGWFYVRRRFGVRVEYCCHRGYF